MNRDEWLNSLKEGDEVYLVGYGSNAIRKIERFTPTRRIVLKGSGNQFINGTHRVDDWRSEHIEELTDEIRASHILKIKLQKINKFDLTLEDIDKINTIYEILYEPE